MLLYFILVDLFRNYRGGCHFTPGNEETTTVHWDGKSRTPFNQKLRKVRKTCGNPNSLQDKELGAFVGNAGARKLEIGGIDEETCGNCYFCAFNSLLYKELDDSI